MRWRLILEGYNPELIYIYIYGSQSIVADVLDRLDIVDRNHPMKPN